MKLAVFIAQYNLDADSTGADMQSNLRNANVIMIWNTYVVTPVYQAFTPTYLHIDLPQIIQGACQMHSMFVTHTPTCVKNYFHSRNEATAKRNRDQYIHMIHQQWKRLQHKIWNCALIT